MTRKQEKAFFQDHPSKVPKKDPNPLLSRPLGLIMYQNRVLSRPLRRDPKMTLLSRTMGNKDQESTSFKTIKNRVKNLNPRYMVLVDEVSQVISDPQTRKKAQPVTEQPLSSPPPPGSRFNPIYMRPRFSIH